MKTTILTAFIMAFSMVGFAQAPTTAADTPPARDAADVISIFSDAYTDINVETFSAGFDDSDIKDTTVAGNATKRIDFTNFLGVEFVNDRQDLSGMTHFHIDFWTPTTSLDGTVFNQKLSNWAGGTGEANALELNINTGTDPAIVSGTWVSVDVPLDDFVPVNGSARGDVAQYLITSNLGVVFVDNIYFYDDGTGTGGGGGTGDDLVTNGDFEAGRAPWTETAGEIRTEGDNSFFFADVATAGNAFDVNLSQNVDITPGETYTMTFEASTAPGETRTMVVGIGESQAPFRANVQEITLTETTETFSLVIPAVNGDDGVPFDGTTRVIFDMGADVGVVVIDNVTLVQGTPPAEGELVTNGDFEAGRAPWTETAGEIRTEGDNSFFFADVATAGNAFDVNLSQNVDITAGETYTMTFEASTAPGETRTMVVGIGESQAPFRANVQEITLTETTETFSLEIPAVNGDDGVPFDGTTRVIFDMGADVGVVVIDNVSLTSAVSTSNEDDDSTLPSEFLLNQNYPNPFNPTTNISFSLPQASQVSITVYDMLGREVAILANQQRFSAGSNQVTFDASNLASGIYIYRLQAGSVSLTKKMTLIK